MTDATTPATLTFVEPSPTAVSRGRGRPALFTESIQAALRANPGKFAVVQTGITSPSRVSVLRSKFRAEGFDFTYEADPTEGAKPGTIRVLGKYEAPVVETEPVVEAPAPQAKRQRPSRSKAAVAARAAAAAQA